MFAINHNTDPSLATLRYRFKDAQFDVAEEPFESRRSEVQSRVVRHSRRSRADALGKAAPELGLKVDGAVRPSPRSRPIRARAARIALMHTWINTQDEGWWRLALDQLAVPVHVHQHAGRHKRCRPASQSTT